MLFVDHDQAQVGSRSENGAAGPDHHLHTPGGDPLPMPVPLRVSQMAVQHGDGRKSAAEPADRLRRQADFRNQDNRLPAVADDFANRLDINFGLSAPGHAVQQDRAVLPRALQSQNRIEPPLRWSAFS